MYQLKQDLPDTVTDKSEGYEMPIDVFLEKFDEIAVKRGVKFKGKVPLVRDFEECFIRVVSED